MATFEFRRHSIKDGDKKGTVGAKGRLLARTVGDQFMRGKRFDRYAVSAVERTRQTLEAFAEGAHWTGVEEKTSLAPLYVNSPELLKMWDACREVEKQGGDMVAAAFSYDPELAERTSATVVKLFQEWVLSLPREEHVLVIGHSPHLELLAYGLTRSKLMGLSECQGFRIHTKVLADDVTVNCVIETKAEDFDPSALRREMFDVPVAPDTVRSFKKHWEND